MLQAPVKVSFVNNSVFKHGAAIYIEDSSMTFLKLCEGDLFSNHSCFFEIESNSTNITDVRLEFINNTAGKSGTAAYGGALKHCHVKVNNVLQDKTGYDTIRQISSFSSNETISSRPLQLCQCSDGVLLGCSTSTTISIIPGRMFNLSLAAVGEVNTTTQILVSLLRVTK